VSTLLQSLGIYSPQHLPNQIFTYWPLFAFWAVMAITFAFIFIVLGKNNIFQERSLNTIVRKLFHALAILLFVPPMILVPDILRFSMGIAIILLVFFEYIRFCGTQFIASSDNSLAAGLHRLASDVLTQIVAPVTNARDRRGPLTLSHVRYLSVFE
jgi:hypothetical protein